MASAVACGVCCWKAAWSPDVSPDETPDVDAGDADDEESQPYINLVAVSMNSSWCAEISIANSVRAVVTE